LLSKYFLTKADLVLFLFTAEKLADLGQEEVSFIDKPSNLVDNRSNIIIELSTQIS